MDTATSTRSSRIALVLCLAFATVILGNQRPAPADAHPLTIHGANAAEELAVDWAMHRYRLAGLEDMPSLDVYLHRSHEACNEGIGLYHAGRIDLCTKTSSEPYQRRFALHELAHAWTEAHIEGAILNRFMEIRGVTHWNDRSEDWKDRGTEQAAEIITWGLGDGEIAPLLPETVDVRTLAGLYELLTGNKPITPAPR